MRRVDSCLVVPAETTSNRVTSSNGTYKVGSNSTGEEQPNKQGPQYDSWPCTSADLLTLEKGFALDTCWIFRKDIPAGHLKASLALLLQEYRPFAGRYDEFSKSVILNDAGVTFEVFEDDEITLDQAVTFQHTQIFAERYIDDASSIIGYRLLNHPLMRVRLTYFAEGGCVLAVRATHGLCDGDTFYSMMDRWAAIARGSANSSEGTVVWDQSQVPYHRGRRTSAEVFQEVQAQGWSHIPHFPAAIRLGMLMRQGIWLHNKERTPGFHLSAKALARMKFAAELDCKTSGRKLNSIGLTTNEVLSSFVCQLMARMFDFEDNVCCGHSTMYNWRGRLPGMSTKFGGNASSAIMTCQFYAGSCLGDIAARMNQTLEMFKSDKEEIQRHVELFLDTHDNGISGHMADPRTLPYLSLTPTTTVTNNFARYPIYQADFGYGKPDLVVPHHCGDQVLIWPSADGDGVVLYFQGATALRIQNMKEEERTWFESELYKFERCLDQTHIQNWFDSRIHHSSSKVVKDQTVKLPSPISVSPKPGSKIRPKIQRGNNNLTTVNLGGFVFRNLVHPLAAMIGL